MRGHRVVVGLAVALVACGKSKAPGVSDSGRVSIGVPAPIGAPPSNQCPPDGRWAKCSVIYRLDRAGLAPKVDSGATPDSKALGGEPLMLRIGLIAKLELHLYSDSTARLAAARSLDRSQYVNGTQEQTMRREKTLIESANLIGLLTSLNGHQRERVSDALTAGPPQPAPQP